MYGYFEYVVFLENSFIASDYRKGITNNVERNSRRKEFQRKKMVGNRLLKQLFDCGIPRSRRFHRLPYCLRQQPIFDAVDEKICFLKKNGRNKAKY